MAKLKANTAKKPHRIYPVVRAAFAGVIRALRLKLDLSEKRVAELSGYSEKCIGKLERRQHTPSYTAAIMLSLAVQQDPADTVNLGPQLVIQNACR